MVVEVADKLGHVGVPVNTRDGGVVLPFMGRLVCGGRENSISPSGWVYLHFPLHEQLPSHIPHGEGLFWDAPYFAYVLLLSVDESLLVNMGSIL